MTFSSTGVRWKWLEYAALSLLAAGLVWVLPYSEVARTPGEENMGAAVLGIAAFAFSIVAVLIAFLYCLAMVLEYRIQNRRTPTRNAVPR